MFPPLVDDGEIGFQTLGDGPGTQHAAYIGRHHHQIIDIAVLPYVSQKNRSSEKIVERDVEKSLDLAGMKIDGQDTIGACLGDKIGDQLG